LSPNKSSATARDATDDGDPLDSETIKYCHFDLALEGQAAVGARATGGLSFFSVTQPLNLVTFLDLEAAPDMVLRGGIISCHLDNH